MFFTTVVIKFPLTTIIVQPVFQETYRHIDCRSNWTVMNVAELDKIEQMANDTIANLRNRAEFDNAKSRYFGNNGIFRNLMQSLSQLPKEQRPSVGQGINRCKTTVEALFKDKLQQLEQQAIITSLGDSIDASLSARSMTNVYLHPLTMIRNRFIDIFQKLGFSVAEGTELETEWTCFDALNTKQNHPSRNERDTFYFNDDTFIANVAKHNCERYMLRSHTSTVQVRTMLSEKPPIRVLSPGRVFRKDTIDATHSPNFHQCEGLVVDKRATVSELTSTLNYFFTELIGEHCEVRMRPSYFPFVSPGFEMDLRSNDLGALSNKWIEVCGCGIVAPSVLENCGIDSKEYTGYAFGIGIERLAMLLYGIDDIRLLYQNDTRFLKQFRVSMIS